MRKTNLKAVFFSLLSRRLRRAGDSPGKSSGDPPTGAAIFPPPRSPQAGIAGESTVESAESVQSAYSALAETTSKADDQLPETLGGASEAWLAKRSSGPPAHWVERVRQDAPELLEDQEKDGAGAAIPLQPPRQLQRKPAPPAPLRLERPTATLSSQQNQSGRQMRQDISERSAGYPASTDRSTAEFQSARVNRSTAEFQSARGPRGLSPDLPQEPIAESEARPGASARLRRRNQEPAGSSPSVNSKKSGAEAGEQSSKEPPKPRGADTAVQSVHFESRKAEAPAREGSGALMDGYETVPHEASESHQSKGGELTGRLELRQVREKRGGERLESQKPLAARPSKVTQWKEASWSGETSKVVSRRDDDLKSQLPVHADGQLTRYPDVIHRETRGTPVRNERVAFDSGKRRAVKREDEVMKPIEAPAAPDRPSYNISADRWPELPGSSTDDYFDDVMAAWSELSHRRRLTSEQTGILWSE
ncbi:MAG TPA: hypothetical protein VJ810_29435 [Blastocatellia bacterium]|nr:hypothetical protein [Blastocatellia bacterium]